MTGVDPHGESLTLGHLRRLVADADTAGHPDSCLLDLPNPTGREPTRGPHRRHRRRRHPTGQRKPSGTSPLITDRNTMGRDTTKASDHKSTNALDGLDDDSVDTGGAYIGFRATNIKLESPPEIGDTLTLVVKVKCIGDGHQLMADGELRPKRSLKVEWCGPAGSKPPTDQVQAGMFDTNGQVTPQAAGEDEDDAEDDDEVDTGDEDQDADAADNVVAFSDGEK